MNYKTISLKQGINERRESETRFKHDFNKSTTVVTSQFDLWRELY